MTPFYIDLRERYNEADIPESTEEQNQFFIFSPFMTVEETPLEQYLLYLLALRLMKTPDGLKTLRELGVQYLKTIGSVIGELEGASAAHWSVALVNQMTAVRVYRRLGLMTANEAAQLAADYKWLWNLLLSKDAIVDTLNGLANLTRAGSGAMTSLATGGA